MILTSFFSLELELEGVNITVEAVELSNQSVPTTLHRGAPLTFSLGFEVPDNTILKKVRFQG